MKPPSNAELAECLEDLARSEHFPSALSGHLSHYNTKDVLAFSAASLRASAPIAVPEDFAQSMAEIERGETTSMFNDKVERANARRYEFLRSEWLIQMLALFPTCDTCDVGLDYAIDQAMLAYTNDQCAEMNAFGDALDGTTEIARLRALLAYIERANRREYDGGPDNSAIDELVNKGLS